MIQFLNAATGTATTAEMLMSFLPMILIIVFMIVLIYLPQKRQDKKDAAMRNSIEIGDKVTTIGGIVGIVSDDSFVINCYSTVEKITANSSYASVVGYSKKGNLQNIYGNSACPSKSAANSAVGSDKAAGTVWKKTTFALLSLDEMKSGAVTVPSSGESCANFAAALNAGATLFNDTPAATLPGKPDVVLRKWTASESYPVLEK